MKFVCITLFSSEYQQTKVERLMRELGLMKFNRSFIVNDETADSTYDSREGLLSASRLLSDGHQGDAVKPRKQQLLVVANRLPVTAHRKGEDSWSMEVTNGGLVSALLGVNELDAKWIGQTSFKEALVKKRCVPIFLDEEMEDEYYNGYCNNILWPLFHYLGLPQEDLVLQPHVVFSHNSMHINLRTRCLQMWYVSIMKMVMWFGAMITT
ncbi:hypothetical protein ZOSMA_24G00010 [Zostera marina]|uniref:Uncharacterized protein n=1 Tax=Zostera marina TaxID=29655 RepID=A0A0K9PG94_ZOSMR|nr:hypothetical protein ZOSMA_24G00010 [Zostera marina]